MSRSVEVKAVGNFTIEEEDKRFIPPLHLAYRRHGRAYTETFAGGTAAAVTAIGGVGYNGEFKICDQVKACHRANSQQAAWNSTRPSCRHFRLGT